MHTIEVAPLADGWRVSLDAIANDLVFRTGSLAEASGRRLAARMAAAGQASELLVRLRDGSLAARIVWPAWQAPEREVESVQRGRDCDGSRLKRLRSA